jgi:hypothetical protein
MTAATEATTTKAVGKGSGMEPADVSTEKEIVVLKFYLRPLIPVSK